MRCAILAGILLMLAQWSQAAVLRVDFGRSRGTVRPLHGLNKGPQASGGTIDLTPWWIQLKPPLTRLHDCQWPYPDVVDVHAIFRRPDGNPARAEDYDWALTDAYLASVRGTGAGIVYRLGESIEHGPVKRFVHPPADPERWAQVCLGIVRHYNEGWAGGTNHQIRYWEVWNEPENRPAMWSGTDEEYIRLYLAAARALKKHDPALKLGGPSLGFYGSLREGRFEPSGFMTNFLTTCRREGVALDFFSWHCYTADPLELSTRAHGVRRVLDEHGFAKTESHLNEWNYLPGNTWEPFSKEAAPEARQKFYEQMGGAAGAAFVATALIELQDAPVDISNFYHGELGPFGLFNEFGVPNRVFYAVRAFARLAALPERAISEGGIPGELAVLAARGLEAGPAHGRILVSHFKGQETDLELEVRGVPEGTAYRVSSITTDSAWMEGQAGVLASDKANRIVLRLPVPAVSLIEFSKN